MTAEQYREAVEWLFVQAPNYQVDGQKAYKPGLDNIIRLCEFFGNPQEKIRCIHIGGTNGKGSTSNMLASVLQEAGYTVGLYNSPHLIDFTERIKVNGKNCDTGFVYDFIKKLKQLPEDIQPSFFEFTTIMAFEYFYQQQVDFAVIEVGLGGRLDSTNIISPMVSAITNVQLDHQDLLGDTIEEIAAEKAGIIKPGIPVISGDEEGPVKKILKKKAQQENALFSDVTGTETHLQSDLKGNYQKKNIRVVLGIIRELQKQDVNISEEHIERGLMHVHRNTGFIGRWFEFSKDPLTICDTAHNQAGLEQVFAQLNSLNRRKHIILGFVNDKKIDDVMRLLPEDAVFYFAKPAIHRGRHPEEYENLLKEAKINYTIFNSVQEAYLSAKQECMKNEMIFIGGSNFVVGEFLEKNLEISE
ncbi:bifunctional folylpolyglutamate synthase/dihydrofolate synthase [Chryseobacterium camelliae]|uniref:bifunctional folylpolyglutamate synthase/dihydrofolate synthase n=1 Tax=Chryseobacterium camelliae TaxID=1265445 RepID=UPI00285FA45C|nr:folylpolyglutamate synthase/dihydrofolate synthase family protein [Chryseobacterium camelliae]MDR6514991.1 dihydrofolate synthase/folylpolyglutamate synthase [Chryseobacterium camelliae]